MTSRTAFAHSLGFATYDDLVSASDDHAPAGGRDDSWYVTPLADGRFAAWDDSTSDPDVTYFACYDDAAEHHAAGREAVETLGTFAQAMQIEEEERTRRIGADA